MELREYLFLKRISQKRFAKKLGVSRWYVSRLCNKIYRPSLELAEKISRVTNGYVPVKTVYVLPKTKEKIN